MFVCFFIVCVFLPHSLLPFGKNLDSKRTIYFEWPNTDFLSKLSTLRNSGDPTRYKSGSWFCWKTLWPRTGIFLGEFAQAIH